MEPGITVEGEVANRRNIERLATQFTRNDHAVGGIADVDSAGFIDHRAGEIEIRWGGIVRIRIIVR